MEGGRRIRAQPCVTWLKNSCQSSVCLCLCVHARACVCVCACTYLPQMYKHMVPL